MFRSLVELDTVLKASGYIADPVTVSTVYLAAALHRPLLLEGVAGAGKTQLAYAVAGAAETSVERLQCYQGIDEAKAIGKFDESLQRLCVELRSKAPDLDWQSLANELHDRRFFAAGPLLKALEYEKSCVLLIDELDKVDHAFEAQALKRASANFGLGLYLYSFFRGKWVLLNESKQLVSPPPLPEWATPAGWLAGARPEIERIAPSADLPLGAVDSNVIREIELMQHELGSHVYRKILRPHRIFFPKDIPDRATADKILTEMKTAADLMVRSIRATERIGQATSYEIIRSFNLKSLDEFSDLALLERLVVALEERVRTLEPS